VYAHTAKATTNKINMTYEKLFKNYCAANKWELKYKHHRKQQKVKLRLETQGK
jgi:hypothetical protein